MALSAEGLKNRVKQCVASARRSFSRENIKSLFTARSFTAGGYTAVSCVAVIAIAAAAVALVESLPSTWVKIDLSEDQSTSLSEETIDMIEGLQDEVTIYFVSEEGEEDEYVQLILDKYADSSDKLDVVQKDPVLYPTFTDQYTSSELEDGSLIITCSDEFEIVSYDDMYTLNTSTYSYDFNAEAAITGAINSLISDDLPTVYLLTGHGEADLPSDITSDLEAVNIELAQLNLLSEGTVPEDADAVVMYAPTSDLSEEEESALLAYLEDGGSFLLMTDYDDSDLPRIANVMNAYGVEAVEGLVVEGDSGYYLSGYPYYLLPTIESHEATGDLSEANSYVLFPLAHGITALDQYRSTLVISPLLSTSSSAYVKADPETIETLQQESDDVSGETMLGVAVSEALDEGETRVVWFSSTAFLDSQIDMRVGGANSELFTSSLTWLCDAGDSVVSLASKSTGVTVLAVDASAASMLSVFLVGIVPLFFLVVGFRIWRTRRTR